VEQYQGVFPSLLAVQAARLLSFVDYEAVGSVKGVAYIFPPELFPRNRERLGVRLSNRAKDESGILPRMW
jgi:hypothetical protein